MSSTKMLLIEITFFNEETGEIEKKLLKHYEGSYGYEVRGLFEKLGEQIAKMVDPYDDY